NRATLLRVARVPGRVSLAIRVFGSGCRPGNLHALNSLGSAARSDSPTHRPPLGQGHGSAFATHGFGRDMTWYAQATTGWARSGRGEETRAPQRGTMSKKWLLAFLLAAAPAAAHNWYPMECCHEMDCAPVDRTEIVPTPTTAPTGA